MQINKLVKKTAAELKIDLCGITDGSELTEERLILEKRAETEYWPQPFTKRDLDQLTKPALQFENLNSIIVTAISYNNGGDSLFLSNYVTVEDYHAYLRQKLKKLAVELQQKLNKDFNYKIFVDTVPFLERALAKRAGLGFIGKNSMLINPELGSYLFLGELFTDLEIEKDEPLEIDCGQCQICLQNCEGGALKDEYLLAGEVCISYLTQKKGILAKSEVNKIGTHIWGCDACQTECPYNFNKEQITQPELSFFDKKLSYFLEIERNNPPSELKNTAIMWRGSRVLLRNALIAVSNLEDEKYFEAVQKKLQDNSPIIRYYAVLALLKINYQRAKELVKKTAAAENNSKYQKLIFSLLEQKGEENEY